MEWVGDELPSDTIVIPTWDMASSNQHLVCVECEESGLSVTVEVALLILLREMPQQPGVKVEFFPLPLVGRRDRVRSIARMLRRTSGL